MSIWTLPRGKRKKSKKTRTPVLLWNHGKWDPEDEADPTLDPTRYPPPSQ